MHSCPGRTKHSLLAYVSLNAPCRCQYSYLMPDVCACFVGSVRGCRDSVVPWLHLGPGCWSSVWAGAGIPAGVAGDCTWPDVSIHDWQVLKASSCPTQTTCLGSAALESDQGLQRLSAFVYSLTWHICMVLQCTSCLHLLAV